MRALLRVAAGTMPEARGSLEEAVFIVILIDYLAAGASMTARDQNTDDFLLSPPD